MNGRRVYHRFQHLVPALRFALGKRAFSKDFWKYMHRKLNDLARRTIANPALEAHVRHELLHIFYKTATIMKNELFGGTMTVSQVFAFLDADPRDVDSLRSITHRADFMKQAIMQNSVLDGEHMEPRFGGWVMRKIKRLRGPVQYIEMQNEYVTLVLLGDHHDGAICRARCDAASGCLTVQPVKGKRSGPITGVDMSFLQFLDDKLGHLAPDVFLETWLPGKVRKGLEAHVDYRGPMETWGPEVVFNAGPLDTLIAHAAPCLDPVTRGTAACPYRNVKFHAVDPRVHDEEFMEPLLQLGKATSATTGACAAVCRFLVWVKTAHPVFTVEEVIRGCLDPGILTPLTNRFCQNNGQLYKQFSQLPSTWQQKLLRATQLVCPVIDMPYDLPGAVLAWLAQVASAARGIVAVDMSQGRGFDVTIIDGSEATIASQAPSDLVLHPTVRADLNQYMDLRPYTARATVETNLYAISRALKVRKDGSRAALAVINMGWVHTELIARTLEAAELLLVTGSWFSADKCLALNGQSASWERVPEPEDDASDSGIADEYGAVDGTAEDYVGSVPIIPRAPFGVAVKDVLRWGSILRSEL
jgi:hypothetical protein